METLGNRIMAALTFTGIAAFGMFVFTACTDALPMTETEQRQMLSDSEVAACEYEDQVPDVNPCYWDADVQGNGQGRSYVVFPDGSLLFD